MRKGERFCYKLARPDGFDFYTGKTINYRGDGEYPHVVTVPNSKPPYNICTSSVIHASANPNDCFVRANVPCSAYRVKGIPKCGDDTKYGFTELVVISEITDLDGLFKWRYSEAANPLNPFKLPKNEPQDSDIELLKQWASVRDSVWDSVGASVWASVGASVRASVWDSVGDSVGAYVGYIFIPVVKRWCYIDTLPSVYPYMASVELWKRGLVPSYDGRTWRLHSGEKAEIVYEWRKP